LCAPLRVQMPPATVCSLRCVAVAAHLLVSAVTARADALTTAACLSAAQRSVFAPLDALHRVHQPTSSGASGACVRSVELCTQACRLQQQLSKHAPTHTSRHRFFTGTGIQYDPARDGLKKGV
jgi:hypothetical protein